MCLADLYLHAHWSVPIWAADAGGEGRVLAHTSKQHHELLLPAYLKIATVKKSGQAQPWGREGWVEGSGGNGTEPLSSPRPEPAAPVCLRGELPEFSPGSYSQPSSLTAPKQETHQLSPIYSVSGMEDARCWAEQQSAPPSALLASPDDWVGIHQSHLHLLIFKTSKWTPHPNTPCTAKLP